MHRYGIRKLCFNITILLLVPNFLTAQNVIKVQENFSRIQLKNDLSYYVDFTGNQTFKDVKRYFKGIPIQNSYPNFGDSSHPHWLNFRIQNTGKFIQKVSLITKGIDSLQTYITNKDSVLYSSLSNGRHTPTFQRDNVSSSLITTFEIKPRIIYSVWIRIRNVHYRLAASPLDLYSYEAGAKFLFYKHFLYSLYIGAMFLILLFSIVLVGFFRERIYWYYFGCVACALGIMLIYNDYTYLVINSLPWQILNKNVLGILSATVPVFYLLFAEQFLEVNLPKNDPFIRASRIVIVFQYLAMAAILLTGRILFEYKILFYLVMGSLSTITLFHLFRQIRTPQGKLFLLATFPVTTTVILESFSDLHHIPVQNIHDYYYITTLTELLVLTAGIIYRFKKNEEEKYQMKQEKYLLEEEKYQMESEILNIEFKAKNEISSNISEKLHHDVSSDLVLSKSQIFSLENQTKEFTKAEDWQYLRDRIDSAYTTVRDLSHLMAKAATNQSLVSMLLNRYIGEQKVEIYLDGLDPDVQIDQQKEVVLFSVVSEIISNALKHAQCTKIDVHLRYNKPEFTIMVEDNGIGFDLNGKGAKGFGLTNIEKKVIHNLLGSIKIDGNQNGTVVIIKTELNPS